MTNLLEIGYIESLSTEAFSLSIGSQFIKMTLSLSHICGVESSKFARTCVFDDHVDSHTNVLTVANVFQSM